MNYKDAGVNIEKADYLTELIRDTVKNENIGMFAGIYDHPYIPEYYLAGCTDGVGTKVLPLIERDLIETIAVDLIAMNLNDLVCVGAKPLFFLDYFATHSLNIDTTHRFIKALKCELSKYNCTLLGGETAELGNLVSEGHFDVGGFAVGIVKKDKILKNTNVCSGDIVIGLKSSGPHSNGYTLIRKLYEDGYLNEKEFEESLSPTNIYVNEILDLCDKNLIKACAHITGGGIIGNLARIIPSGLCANISKNKLPDISIFKRLSTIIGEEESFKTFNMGAGMCIIISPENLDEVFKICSEYEPFIFGGIENSENSCSVRIG